MSSQDILLAENCAGDEELNIDAIECPFSGGSLPTGCAIPFNGTGEEYCLSLKIGVATDAIVVLAVLVYMIAIGAAMEIEKIKHAARQPKPPLVGLFCQVVLNPFVCFALIAVFGKDFPISVRLTAILIASAPGGNGSNLLTFLAWGSVELSVIMTIFSTLMAFATTPFFVFLGSQVIWADESTDLSVDFLAIVLAAIVVTTLPSIGLVIRYKISETFGKLLATWGVLIGIVLTILSALLFLGDPLLRKGIRSLGWEVWVCSIFLNICALTMGYACATILKLPERFRRSIAFEVGSQNITIPLAIITVSFDGGPVQSFFVPFIATYLIASIPANYGLMLFWRYCIPLAEEHHDGYDEEEEEERKGTADISTIEL